MTPPPTPEAQLAFLSKIQRLFAEGDFTATYKFALLISLADLAVERGRDDGAPLALTMPSISAKFIELYWQQTAPYSSAHAAATPGVLAQNVGKQAAAVSAIVQFRQLHPGATVQSARSHPGYDRLLRDVARTVADQPVRYLQNLGGTTEPFLYVRARDAILLQPGVAYCLRRFQPLVQQLARSHWIGHLKRNQRNIKLLGQADDLESFLFEASRQALSIVSAGLRKLVGGNCFYCGSRVAEADVDHFVPFSQYPRDLVHNFVLAHPACNRSKSDMLAARKHLERWLAQIADHDDDLQEIGADAGLPADRGTCHAVARWSYSNAATSGARPWVRPREFEAVDGAYLERFA